MIGPRLHAVLDYLSVAALVAMPLALGLSGSPRTVLLTAALVILTYSLITDYPLGALRVLPLGMHLMIDAGTGLVLILTPWLLNFEGSIHWPFLLFGAISILVPALTAPALRRQRSRKRFS